MNSIGETTLEINLSNLEHNFKYLKNKLNTSTQFLAVVKAFAYGTDMITVAKKLEELEVDYFAVAYVKEGVSLRDAGITSPILVLHPQKSNFEELIDRCLEPSLYSHKTIEEFIKVAQQKKQKNYPVHLKFNTGLNRLGLNQENIDWIHNELNQSEEVKITSIFSHLAASDDAKELEFTKTQIEEFKEIYTRLSQKLNIRPIRHLLNTSGILNYPENQFEMVRSGIGLYGYGNTKKIDEELKPIASLKTIISQLHTIEKGESVGYNRAFITKRKSVIATLPIGHADGIHRNFGNGKSYVSINNQKAVIVGNVCMDMIMIDVTDITCKEGDEVVFFGGDSSAEKFANSANTISYEILTAISTRVKRRILN